MISFGILTVNGKKIATGRTHIHIYIHFGDHNCLSPPLPRFKRNHHTSPLPYFYSHDYISTLPTDHTYTYPSNLLPHIVTACYVTRLSTWLLAQRVDGKGVLTITRKYIQAFEEREDKVTGPLPIAAR